MSVENRTWRMVRTVGVNAIAISVDKRNHRAMRAHRVSLFDALTLRLETTLPKRLSWLAAQPSET